MQRHVASFAKIGLGAWLVAMLLWGANMEVKTAVVMTTALGAIVASLLIVWEKVIGRERAILHASSVIIYFTAVWYHGTLLQMTVFYVVVTALIWEAGKLAGMYGGLTVGEALSLPAALLSLSAPLAMSMRGSSVLSVISVTFLAGAVAVLAERYCTVTFQELADRFRRLSQFKKAAP